MPEPEALAGTTRIAVPLVAAAPDLKQQIDEAVALGADLVELRVDLIEDVEAVAAVLAGKRDVPIILTIRSQDEGGAWDGEDAERIALFERLGLELPGYVDVEYATWQRSSNLRQKIGLVCETQSGEPINRPLNKLILSHHNFEATPEDVGEVLRRLQAEPAAVAKAAFMPADASDSVRILDALRQSAGVKPTIVLGMGEAGLMTRVLARKFGGWLTFASLAAQQESAPGQPTIETLRQLYRWESLNAATRVLGLIGWPVGHSKGPALHNAAMATAGVDGVYLPLPVEPTRVAFDRFMNLVANADWLDVAGFSVTLPHKTHAREWLEQQQAAVSESAMRTGAVNTLIRHQDGSWSGDNTDVDGILAALSRAPSLADEDWSGREVLVLGAGGVARAIVVAVQSRGAQVTLVNRSSQRAEALAVELGCEARPWEQREQISGDVVINGTSLGMWPNVDDSPLVGDSLKPGMVVFDTVYNPLETKLLNIAKSHGCETITGDHMFLAQAARQFELWHGVAPDLNTMRTALANG